MQNQILVCETDPDCDTEAVVPLLSGACFLCLVSQPHEHDQPPSIEPCLSDGVVYSYERPPDGGCNNDTAVCVESDVALMHGADFESLTPGCQCCFMSVGDDPAADPFVLCLAPLLPQVDFCADPGNAQSNPNGTIYECRHACANWDAPETELAAAGCFNDEHEDHICVTEGVYAPGEMQPWGDACCSWCEDWDGDGDPDYQGCCEGMRADGQMGCEDRRCEWMCNGVSCFEHGESQAMCQENGGRWAVDSSCEEKIAMQGVRQMYFAERGIAADFAAAIWLGDYGETCCTGYDVPGQGSCDFDIEIYVSFWPDWPRITL